jgi:hypothetical protein
MEDRQGPVIEKGDWTRLRALRPDNGGTSACRRGQTRNRRALPGRAIDLSPRRYFKLRDLTTSKKTNKISYL